MTRVMVLGITGMLGHVVYDTLIREGFNPIGTCREDLNAENVGASQLVELLTGVDYVINCIGVIKPYISSSFSPSVQRAITVNALFPHKLAFAAGETSSRVIQIATDCVYDGKKGGYKETDEHNTEDVYGKTKSLGEVQSPNLLNLRCSIIGREKAHYESLLEWFLAQPERSSINGFSNHIWNGITTIAFAKICLGLIRNATSWFCGLHHVVPADSITKEKLLKKFAETFNRQDIDIQKINTEKGIDRSLATLDPNRNKLLWHQAGYVEIPTIHHMVEEMVKYGGS
ncbi:MAG: SDR family oxidoreductase [Planctomycetaceae bacterium]|nr:SDR family oxidoreductase [Planctomycetaceae bacterium]